VLHVAKTFRPVPLAPYENTLCNSDPVRAFCGVIYDASTPPPVSLAFGDGSEVWHW